MSRHHPVPILFHFPKLCKPQQIFQNYAVMKGYAPQDENFELTMIDHYHYLRQQIYDGIHISFRKVVEDEDDLKRHLIHTYTNDILRHRSNLCNILFTEN